ncbi:MAG: Type 1 glutamine amidotransferase-like domain-containing protein [Bacilli bacterium]|nr:Type 1 glutamine amidotransferase-like domain-containing protein [Bacilli bacterium]
MKKFMLIGGGNIGRGETEYETKEIDEEVVRMAEKENPNFLFIGLASSFSDSYYDIVKVIYKNLGCTPAYLKKKNILNNPDIVKNKIESADIIYFGGGDTIKLLDNLREYNMIPLIEKAIERGCVLVGVSAGAIMMCKEGYSDSYKLRGESDSFDFLEGLGFLNISFCPHYEDDSYRKHDLIEDLEKENRMVYALPNNTAMKIIDNSYEIIKSDPSKKVSIVTLKDKKLEEKTIEKGSLK